MITNAMTRRISTAIALGAVTLTALAPAAHAGHAYGHDKWRGDSRSGSQTRVIVREHSSVGPALAGLVGGLVLGAALGSHSAPAQERVVYRDRYVDDGGACPPARDDYGYDSSYDDGGYYSGAPDGYYDPYTHARYASLDACGAQFRRSRPSSIVFVIEVRGGRSVGRYGYDHGTWRHYRAYSGYRAQRGYDRSDRTWDRDDHRYRDDDRRYRDDDRRYRDDGGDRGDD